MTDKVIKCDEIELETHVRNVTIEMEDVKDKNDTNDGVEQNHKAATRVSSNLSSGSCDERGGSTPSPIPPGSKKLSLTSTLSTLSSGSDAPYITMMSGISTETRNMNILYNFEPKVTVATGRCLKDYHHSYQCSVKMIQKLRL